MVVRFRRLIGKAIETETPSVILILEKCFEKNDSFLKIFFDFLLCLENQFNSSIIFFSFGLSVRFFLSLMPYLQGF